MLNLQNPASVTNQSDGASPYNYRAARVHVVNLYDAKSTHLKCFRCRRDLPLEQFQPLFGVSSSLKNLNPSIRRSAALHPHCYKCREQEKGEWVSHPKYSPALDRFWTGVMQRVIPSARTRGLLVAIDKDDLLGLFLRQEGRCALTGIEMDWHAKGTTGRGQRTRTAPSVDRIDSHGNYTLDNIQIVLSAVNSMKNDMSTDQFVALCEQVAAHRLTNG